MRVRNARRQAGGNYTAEALEAPAPETPPNSTHAKSNVELPVLNEEEDTFPLQNFTCQTSLKDIRAFRKPLTYQKYEAHSGAFCEYVAPKADPGRSRRTTSRDPCLEKIKGFESGYHALHRPGPSCHNFFSKLKLDNPVKEVPRLPRFRRSRLAKRCK